VVLGEAAALVGVPLAGSSSPAVRR